MREKSFVLVITLVILFASIIVPQNIDVKATEDYGDPGIDYEYIYFKTENLSDIVFQPSADERGREFGEFGEIYGVDLIKEWMEDIGLDCIHNESIDEIHNDVKLNRKKQFKKSEHLKLHIEVVDKTTHQIVDSKYNIDCFPFFGRKSVDTIHDVRVVERFMWLWPVKQIVLFNEDWRDPWLSLGVIKYLLCMYTVRSKGFILIDDANDSVNTKFMGPSNFDEYFKPGFSINNTIGSWIRSYLDDYKVLATIRAEYKYEDILSKNVIGQINGTDNDTFSIVCAHHDCWWNQGSIDESLETALVLGIAKFIKERELNLTHSVKFIAFGGEEFGFRGARDYIVDHDGEDIKWVINPGNFGHGDKYYYNWLGINKSLDFEIPSNNGIIENLTWNITNHLQFTDRTGIDIDIWDDAEFGAEDSIKFVEENMCDGAVQFGRWPYRGYHRDGSEHSGGDVMNRIDNASAQIECEVVASVALHLTVDTEHRFDYISLASWDKSGDGEDDSVQVDYTLTSDTNASIFGRVNASMYNSTGHCIINKKSGLEFLEKGETVNGSMVFTVPSNQPDGEFTIRLAVLNYWNEANDWYNETHNLNAYNLTSSSFSFSTSAIKTHHFIDNSLPAPGKTITKWNWSFDDGNYSTSQNPNHTYYDGGVYNVSLNVTDSSNNTNITFMTIIVENEEPSVLIGDIETVCCINDSLNFKSNCTDNDGSIVNYTWDFGDGNYSYTQNPTFKYSKSGFYKITLTTTDDDNSTNSTALEMIIAGAIIDDSFPSDTPNTYRWKEIQSGVNNVSDDDIVYVKIGGYTEGVVVDKSIYLLGEHREKVIVNNSGDIVFDIKNESVVLDNFTIDFASTCVFVNSSDNCSFINCSVTNATYGIKLSSGSDNNTIVGCHFEGHSYGIFVSGNFNRIGSGKKEGLGNDTIFKENIYGIYFDHSVDNIVLNCSIDAVPGAGSFPFALYGICLDESKNSTILNCNIFNSNTTLSNGYGIYLAHSDNNHIIHNLIHKNNRGIYLTSSSDNFIEINNVSNNSAGGILINLITSNNNTLIWNDFIDNDNGRIPQANDNGASSNWNSINNETYYYVAAGEGNYWSDYTGTDSDGDGIGDTRYVIQGTAGAVDAFPVMTPRDFFN